MVDVFEMWVRRKVEGKWKELIEWKELIHLSNSNHNRGKRTLLIISLKGKEDCIGHNMIEKGIIINTVTE